MNPDQILAHLKRLSTTLTPRQIATLALAFVTVVGVLVGTAYWANTPSYALLYTDLDAESATAVVNRLKNAKVPYVLDNGGQTVRVSADRVDEMRLAMATEGLPTTGRVGFEIFDRTAFGTTDFLEHVNYRRGLEGELARTIATISEVASARVHIALAKDSLFTGDTQQAKASVVLKLRNNRPLAGATVAGIAGLVAASVESLRPEAVVIVDTFGRPLSHSPATADDDVSVGAPLERQQRLERDLSTRVMALLEPVVGVGRVRVNVSARLNPNTEEQTEERWDPTTVLRSRQSTTDMGGTTAGQGIAGARANAPPNATTAPKPVTAVAAATPSGRTSETTNYEVSKVTRHTVAPRGQLARLSVAVILDDERTVTKDEAGKSQSTNKPRSATDIERIQRLVSAAVGLDPSRGDQLTVENVAFEDAPLPEEVPTPSWWQELLPNMTPALLLQALRILGVVALGIIAFVVILKPLLKSAMDAPAQLRESPQMASLPQGARTVADLQSGRPQAAGLQAAVAQMAAPLDARRLPSLAKGIARKADEHPENIARLVSSWLAEEEK